MKETRMSVCNTVRHLVLLLITCVVVNSYSAEEQNKWTNTAPPSDYGNIPSNNIVDDLSESIERFSGSDNIYTGVASSLSESWNSCPDDDELPRNASVTCHGVRIVRRVISQLLDIPRNFQLADGVQLVTIPPSTSSSEPSSRSMLTGEGSLFSRIRKFLSSHELRIRLPDLLPTGQEWSQFVQHFVGDKEGFGARKKDKGQGMLLAMALMMKGLMAALGLGGLGMIAMKALMVSAMALLLSAVVGIKKLASKDDDHGGGHVVSVVPVHHSGGDHGHYRKKRSSTDGGIVDAAWLAYRGYKHLFMQP